MSILNKYNNWLAFKCAFMQFLLPAISLDLWKNYGTLEDTSSYGTEQSLWSELSSLDDVRFLKIFSKN